MTLRIETTTDPIRGVRRKVTVTHTHCVMSEPGKPNKCAIRTALKEKFPEGSYWSVTRGLIRIRIGRWVYTWTTPAICQAFIGEEGASGFDNGEIPANPKSLPSFTLDFDEAVVEEQKRNLPTDPNAPKRNPIIKPMFEYLACHPKATARQIARDLNLDLKLVRNKLDFGVGKKYWRETKKNSGRYVTLADSLAKAQERNRRRSREQVAA